MPDFQAMGIPTVDYGNNIRQVAFDQGVKNAFDFPGFVPAYIRPLFCEGKGPFRWVALSGDPEDIYKTDAKIKELFPDLAYLHVTEPRLVYLEDRDPKDEVRIFVSLLPRVTSN